MNIYIQYIKYLIIIILHLSPLFNFNVYFYGKDLMLYN